MWSKKKLMLSPWQCCLSMMLLMRGLWWVPFCISVECDACCHISVSKCFLVFPTTPYSPTLGPAQAFLWYTVGWETWQCWKPPSPVLRVSSETASLLCKRPRTDVSAPLSMLGGASTGFRMSTLITHGTYLLKTWKTLHSLVLWLQESMMKSVT